MPPSSASGSGGGGKGPPAGFFDAPASQGRPPASRGNTAWTCPNAGNKYHQCTEYCRERWEKGTIASPPPPPTTTTTTTTTATATAATLGGLSALGAYGEDASDSEDKNVKTTALPQGFFDDHHADNKARNVEEDMAKKLEAELDSLQKDLDADKEAQKKKDEDDEKDRAIRDELQELETQMNAYRKAAELEKKKEAVKRLMQDKQARQGNKKKRKTEPGTTGRVDSSSSSIDSAELEGTDLFDWRAKTVY